MKRKKDELRFCGPMPKGEKVDQVAKRKSFFVSFSASNLYEPQIFSDFLNVQFRMKAGQHRMVPCLQSFFFCFVIAQLGPEEKSTKNFVLIRLAKLKKTREIIPLYTNKAAFFFSRKGKVFNFFFCYWKSHASRVREASYFFCFFVNGLCVLSRGGGNNSLRRKCCRVAA